jgi:hypothetical protein
MGVAGSRSDEDYMLAALADVRGARADHLRVGPNAGEGRVSRSQQITKESGARMPRRKRSRNSRARNFAGWVIALRKGEEAAEGAKKLRELADQVDRKS